MSHRISPCRELRLIGAAFAILMGGHASSPVRAEESGDQSNRIAILVEQLGADGWEDRERALENLLEIGEPAIPFLASARSSPDLEIARRAELALDLMSGECTVELFLQPTRWEYRLPERSLILRDSPLRGLCSGDRILALDGGKVDGPDDLRRRVLQRSGNAREGLAVADRLTVLGGWKHRTPADFRPPAGSRHLTLVRDLNTWVVYLGVRKLAHEQTDFAGED